MSKSLETFRKRTLQMLFPLPYIPSIPHPLNLVSGFTASLNLLSLISTSPSVLPDPLKHLLFLSCFVSLWQFLSVTLIPSWNPLSSELLWSFSQGIPSFVPFLLFYLLPVLLFSHSDLIYYIFSLKDFNQTQKFNYHTCLDDAQLPGKKCQHQNTVLLYQTAL